MGLTGEELTNDPIRSFAQLLQLVFEVVKDHLVFRHQNNFLSLENVDLTFGFRELDLQHVHL